LQAQREREAALETLADREMTIAKFRELVQRMQEQSQELQQRLERESTKPVSALPEILDFKVQLSLLSSPVFSILHSPSHSLLSSSDITCLLLGPEVF
jgi:hypothetical protein